MLALATATAGLAIAIAVVWQERLKQAVNRRDEQALQIGRGCLVMPNGALPTVAEAADAIRLGVHPTAPVVLTDPVDQPGNDRLSAYVPRDVDGLLCEKLARGGFVLLVGDSTAGKSRTAYQAMRATLPDHVLIAPMGLDVLESAFERASEIRKCVVWLNDLEGYLGLGGLNLASISRLLDGGNHHRVILATLRSAEEDRFLGGGGGDQNGRLARKAIRETLEQAHRISIQRIFSISERERARDRCWDHRISDALEHADEYGIAEYLAAGPELMRDWENAWGPNTDPGAPSHPTAAALIAAAVDLRRAGFLSPPHRTLLEDVHDHYLIPRGGNRLRPESLEEAWKWATRPRRATTSLLQPIDEYRIQVFDYLVDTVQRHTDPDEHVCDEVIQAALAWCAPNDADIIGQTAWSRGRYHVSELASHRAIELRTRDLGPEHPDTLASRTFHANTLRDLGRYVECEEEHRVVREICTRLFGPEYPETLSSRHGHAFALICLERYDEAIEELQSVIRIRASRLGLEHEDTLTSRHVYAIALAGVGRLTESEEENRLVLEIWNRRLGANDQSTLFSRGNLARTLHRQGRLVEAEEGHRSTLAIRIRVLGEEHPDTLWSRFSLACIFAETGRRQEAVTEMRAVLETQTRVLGCDHPRSLITQEHLKRLDSEER